jgi:hypothetical protein
MTAHITVYLLLDKAAYDAGMDESVLKAQGTGTKITKAGEDSAKGFQNAFGKAQHGIAGIFTSIGNEANNLGIPFGNMFTKMGASIGSANTKAIAFRDTLESIGKLTLLVGAAAGAAIAGESIKDFDAFSRASGSLKSSISATGHNFAEFAPQIDAVNKKMQGFGYNSTDSETALSSLVVATGSTSKAISLMGTVANMAATRHTSLATAAQDLNSVLAGSSRALMQYGVNLNISSSRLHSQQIAQESLKEAQTAFAAVQQKLANNEITGASAHEAYSMALQKVQNAQIEVKLASQSTQIEIDALNKRLGGTASAVAKTFAGQIEQARASLHNLGTEIGGHLVVILGQLEVHLAHIVDWLQKNKAVAIILGSVIGGFLTLSVITFVGGALARLITGTMSATTKFLNMGPSLGKSAGQIGEANATIQKSAATTATAVGEEATAVDSLGTAANGAQENAAKIVSANEEIATSSSTTAGTVQASDTKVIESNQLAGASFAAMIPIIGAVALAVSSLIVLWGQESAAADAAKIAQGAAVNKGANAWEAAIGAGGPNVLKNAAVALQQEKATRDAAGGTTYQEDYFGRKFAGSPQEWAKGYAEEHNKQFITQEAKQRGISFDQAKALFDDYTKVPVHDATWNAANALIQGQEKLMKEYAKDPAALKKAEKAYGKEYADSYNPADYGKPKNPKDKTPGAGGGGGTDVTTPNPLQTRALSLLQQFQSTLSQGNFLGLQTALSSTAKEQLTILTKQLNESHKAALEKLASQLWATWKAEEQEYHALVLNQNRIALSDEISAQAQQLTDQTNIMSAMSAQLIANITDATTVATNKATATADQYSSAAQTQADILGERGLYGLNLIAQEMKVNLDKVTAKYTAQVDHLQTVASQTAKAGDNAVNAAKVQVAKLQKHSDMTVAQAQKFADLMQAGGTTTASALAQTGLKESQAKQALALALAQRHLEATTEAAAKANANAQKAIAATQNAGKIVEAKLAGKLQVEQAKASTEFAGSGVHIEITGIQPTDANAVASAVSWNMRTKVPK